ncbi:hypothetical protein JOF56_003743 [Kibdelosporangium banguiense]|uniref:Uncharacterized protein n=1 Tax=Kibdelosporangium banguiense TaxID=1365924 RepID=A0ABS4TG12_9PSEU|nr:hypothetical protein [Kibdelosporangium banguiense]MBP2323358.1 hypothetical protein [Kibdelosporangium banguiense]
MAQLISREELALVLDEDISEARFNALYASGLRVVSAGYNGDPEAAKGRAAQVVAGVLFGVLVRIGSNPKGARQLNAGGAGLTFGGADADIAAVFSLTDDERANLDSVSPAPIGRSRAFTIRPGGGQ